MPNALASERSPYLRQHQLNPVDWMPWGEPALRRAQELKRPILLSIGYSACHWCHVMARESFENVETAALMNFRYSVDASWQVPHFEKMLYDNAQLLSLFSEAYRANRSSYYRYAVKRTAEWLIREMTVAGGAFACSLDAESEGKEGAYYLLTADGLDSALGDDAARFVERYFNGSADFADGKVLNRLSGHATEGDHARCHCPAPMP